MLKKILSLTLVSLLALSFSACNPKEDITLEIDDLNITMIEGQTYQISYDTNDSNGLLFGTENDSIVTVDESGIVTAIGEGETVIGVKSRTNPSVIVDVTFTVRKLITLTANDLEITLTEEDIHTVIISSNDEYTFESANTEVFVVDDAGQITAKSEGTAKLIVTSTYDESVEIEIDIIVEKLVVITNNQENLIMVVGDSKLVDVVANDELEYESRNSDIATIDADGNITALKFGTATIRVISSTNPEMYIELTVTVFKYTEEIEISGNNILITGMTGQLEIDPSPVGAYSEVTWESNDTDIVTVNENGEITGVAIGNATVIATSVLDNEVVDTYDIEVINVSIVDGSKTTGDTYEYLGVELAYGERLFDSIESALLNSPLGTKIIISSGTYTENINITSDGSLFEGLEGAIIVGQFVVTGDNVTIKNLVFEGASNITTNDVTGFEFSGNIVRNITGTNGFLLLNNSVGAIITENEFTNIGSEMSVLIASDFVGGRFLISKNNIDGAKTAIQFIAGVEYDITTEINIERNTITNIVTVFDIDLDSVAGIKQIEIYARFNALSNYTYGAVNSAGSIVDYTLNYWGSTEMDYTKFINVDPLMLRGFYTMEDNIISESNFNPAVPVVIEITNPIDEIMIGETHTLEYTVLPLDMVNPLIKYITSAPSILAVNQLGQLTPLTSGTATISVRSAINSSIKTTVTIVVVTTPGVEVSSSHILNDLEVGDTFTLYAQPFPVSIADEDVTFTSSDPGIATIDSDGLVNTVSEGVVTITTSLVSDPLIMTEFTFVVNGTLDENNLLDYLTMNQVMYSTSHEWTAFGFQYNYFDKRYESVSRYYFDNVEINTSKIVPVFYAVRPGEPMDPLPSTVTQYNPENIHWVVIHDTASTALGSNALAHANYLYNAANNETELWVSWHYTIDDTNVYQHLPEDERGFHAGDGSTNPGEGSYLGGGNRNGVGIEMSINEDGDMMRTWQRTAKLTVDILVRNGLPLSQQAYHNDFSGKDCPNTLRNAGLIPLFEVFLEVEYKVKTEHSDAEIIFTSNNPEYLDNHGRIIAMPQRAITVSYTITVTEFGITESRTFYTYLPGTVH